MSLFQRAALSVLALTVIAVPGLLPTQASASVSGSAAAAVPCLKTTATRPEAPKWRRYADTTPVTAKDLAALPAAETRRAYVNREVRRTLAARITLPVYVHVIKGKHKGERNPAGPRRVRQVIAILNKGMAGGQSNASAPMRYRFALRKIDYTRNEGWYHAYLFGPRDVQAKRKLHRGGPRTLNLYINGGGPKGSPILGWSRFPWQYAATPKLDSVTIGVAGLPGGSARGYNLGDTVIHETGHWLGLFHPFQGGCDGGGDLVADTPAEAEPSFGCNTSRDTCTDDPGNDPVHNFMDYSLDRCMLKFTPGQVQRADAAFAKWR